MDRLASLSVEPDIARAETLPGWVYTSAEVLEAARERVLTRSWQCVADASRARARGEVHPFTLGGVPLVLTKDEEGRAHCLSNVCTHRGNVLCAADGKLSQLRCRYHGRRFTLDGRFASMPDFDGAVGFPSAKDDLPRVPFATWRDLLTFASLAPAAPFDELVEAVDARCGYLPLDRAVLDPTRSRDYDLAASWALYCDNYLEGFHIPFVHAGLAKAIDARQYRTELHGASSLQVGIATKDDDAFDVPDGHPDHGERVAAYWWWLWPSTMLNFYTWGLSVNAVVPLAVDRTRVAFRAYVWDASRLDRGAGGDVDRVEREDEAIVESVQRGVRSPLYDRGRYSPTRETAVHHFHRMLAAALRRE